jgi:TusA-related sulfurtransferase
MMGQRVVLGTVEEVASGQAKVDTGEVQPRFIPLKLRQDKDLPDLKKGDRVEITVNDQNQIVDVHVQGEVGHHRVVQGQLAQSLKTGHEKAVIRTTEGKEEPYLIRPMVRSKVASIPVGVDAVFLIDEADKIADVTFGDKEAVGRAAELWQKKTPLKGNFERIAGTVYKPLDGNRITIRTAEGEEKSYEVRPLVQKAVSNLSEGRSVVLLVDDEQKVTDIALPPTSD